MQQSVVVNFQSRIFLNRNRNTYLLVAEGEKYSHFVTMETGMIETKRVPKASQFVKELIPYNKCSLKHAAHVYMTSTLEKSSLAKSILQSILRNQDNSKVDFLPGNVKEKAEVPTRQERTQEKANEITLEKICEDLKLNSKHIRAWFREHNVPKPSNRWTWPKSKRDEIVKLIRKLEPQ